jgi:hypothetical protein
MISLSLIINFAKTKSFHLNFTQLFFSNNVFVCSLNCKNFLSWRSLYIRYVVSVVKYFIKGLFEIQYTISFLIIFYIFIHF